MAETSNSGQVAMHRLLGSLLRLPIFYKVLLANCLIVGLGTIAGTWLVVQHTRTEPGSSQTDVIALLAAAGLGLSLAVNAAVLKAAFLPFRSLSDAAEQVRRGNFAARAEHVLFEDPEIERLTDTLNAMLDAVESHRAEVRRLSSQALSAQEEERKRIARELHDETAQALTFLLVRLRVAEKSGTLEDMKTAVAEVRALAGDTLESVRKLALDLRPSALDDLGLVPALEWYTKQYSQRLPIDVSFSAIGFDHRLPPDLEVALYRVVQEALTNVAKHSDAHSVTVLLEYQADSVRAVVEDDGHGFDVSAKLESRERGLGLFGMQERLELVQGKLSIESGAGEGTRVTATAPVTHLGSLGGGRSSETGFGATSAAGGGR